MWLCASSSKRSGRWRVYPSENRLAENFLLKRTASHGIELLGILAFHASPVWILAALADATGGGRKLIQEISQALKEEGLLEPDASFETMDQMLDGLEKTSGHLAVALNLPPVNIGNLRHEWAQLKGELGLFRPKTRLAWSVWKGYGTIYSRRRETRDARSSRCLR